MMTRDAALLSGLVVALLFAACGGGEEPQPTPSVTVARPSPTPEPKPTPTPTPEVERAPRLIFLRSQPDPFSPLGVIHVSYLDGSNVIQLTPADVDAIYVGLVVDPQSAVPTLYYLARQDENAHALWRLDFGTAERSSIFAFEVEVFTTASVSPDGRFIAFLHIDGTDLLEVATMERRGLLPGGCQSGGCHGYAPLSWSPDGTLLMAGEFYPDGGYAGIVDPLEDSPEFISAHGGGHGEWSPLGDTVCTTGLYGQPSGLFLSHAPTWQDTRDALEGNPHFDTRIAYIDDCVWLDENRIAFTSQDTFGGASGVFSYDLTTDEVVQVYSIEGGCHDIVAMPGVLSVVYQPCTTRQRDTRPEIVNLQDGSHTPVLQPGDWVVAVTQPIALPEGIVAAAPEVRPCAPLIAGCEAQVTNVAPQRLNVRVVPDTEATLTGKLSEGDVVCLIGSSALADGFRWWYARSESGIEGYVAQGDPQEPDEPWLTPTGRKCEE